MTAPSLGWKKWTGIFVAVHADSVILQDNTPGTVPATVAMEAITRFEVNHGNRPPHSQAVLGMVGGAAIMLGTGISVAILYCDPSWCNPGLVIASFTLVGAGVGLVAGSLVKATPYRTVKLQPLVAAPISGPGRLGLQVRIKL